MGIQNACHYFSLGSSRMSRRIGNTKYIVFVLMSTKYTYMQFFKRKHHIQFAEITNVKNINVR